MITIQTIMDELKKYNSDVTTLYAGISQNIISELEQKIDYDLPTVFKNFLENCNGFRIGFTRAVFGIHSNESLDIYENYRWETTAAVNPLPKHFLVISPNGLGDYYCLDLNTIATDKSDCKVVFWQHDDYFREKHPVIAEGFLQFIWDILQKSQKEIDYDGTKK